MDTITREDVAQALTATGLPTTPDQVTDEQLKQFAAELEMEPSLTPPTETPAESPADQPPAEPPPAEAPAPEPKPDAPPAPRVWTEDELKDPQGNPNHPLHDIWVKERQEKLDLKRRIEELEAKNNPLHDKEINDPESETFGAITLEEATLQGGNVMKEYLAARDAYHDGIRSEEAARITQQQQSESEQRAALDRAIEEYKSKIPDANPDAVIRRHGRTLLDGTPNPNFRPLTWEEGHAVNEIEAAGGLAAYKQKLREEGARSAAVPPPQQLAEPPIQSFSNGMGVPPGTPIPGAKLPTNINDVATELARGRQFSLQEILDMEKTIPGLAEMLR